MQEQIATIVPGATRDDAITAATTVFETLTAGGETPVYSSYTLFSDVPDPTSSGTREAAHRIDSHTADDVISALWEATLADMETLLRTAETHVESDFESDGDTPGTAELVAPGSIAYARAHHLYDDAARPVLTKRHLNTVTNAAAADNPDADPYWVVQAFVEY